MDLKINMRLFYMLTCLWGENNRVVSRQFNLCILKPYVSLKGASCVYLWTPSVNIVMKLKSVIIYLRQHIQHLDLYVFKFLTLFDTRLFTLLTPEV